MERTMSVEEKIRRAEAIYERRKGKDQGQITTINVTREKKDIKLLKKLIIQIIICSSIYLVIWKSKKTDTIITANMVIAKSIRDKVYIDDKYESSLSFLS